MLSMERVGFLILTVYFDDLKETNLALKNAS
jgi:hypothetical protein